jgi:hypothetical protein
VALDTPILKPQLTNALPTLWLGLNKADEHKSAAELSTQQQLQSAQALLCEWRTATASEVSAMHVWVQQRAVGQSCAETESEQSESEVVVKIVSGDMRGAVRCWEWRMPAVGEESVKSVPIKAVVVQAPAPPAPEPVAEDGPRGYAVDEDGYAIGLGK